MNFKNFLQEKLELSQYRQIVKMWKQSGVKKKFDHVFVDKDRLYEPYEGSWFSEKKSPIEKNLETFLSYRNHPYQIYDYNKGLLISKNKEKANPVKIGKVLLNIIDSIKKDTFDHMRNLRNTDAGIEDHRKNKIKEVENILKDFTNDKTRALKGQGNYLICYSRHAYDIAGMSTDRGWESCMTLPGDKRKPKGGENAHYVPAEIKNGTIIAYLIKENDKNLKHPIGRMLIKPFINVMNPENPEELMMVACTSGYGTVPGDMIKQVTDWTKKLNSKVGFGVFHFAGVDDTGVKDYKIVNYPKTIEDFKKTYKTVEVFTDIFQLLNKEVYKAFIRAHWNKTNEFTFTQMSASKVYIYDWKAIMENFTADDYVEMFKHGHDIPDDIGYELTKGNRNLYGAGVFDEKRKEIINIRLIAYMVKEYKYSTEPELATEKQFSLWLHQNRMFSEKNMNLYEPMKLYYEKLKKIMRKN